jgi:hypothetical protein
MQKIYICKGNEIMPSGPQKIYEAFRNFNIIRIKQETMCLANSAPL